MMMVFVMGMMMRMRGVGCSFRVDAIDQHAYFAGVDSAAIYFFDFERRANVQGGYGFVEQFWIDAGIDERTQKHVAADSGKAFKISNSHKVQSSKAGAGECSTVDATNLLQVDRTNRLDWKDGVHGTGAIALAVQRDIFKAEAAKSRRHAIHGFHVQCARHFLAGNFNANHLAVIAHAELPKSHLMQ